ncbi:MAG: lipid A biosynthesis acyltransferase [Halofilum sp. (in: g-proteobacteria)]
MSQRKRRQRDVSGAALTHPRFWPSWLSVGLLRLAAMLPLAWQRAIGRGFGLALYAATRERRRIARTNLRLCFPDLSDRAREHLVRDHYRALGESLFEMAFAWWGPAERLRRLGRFRGREHLDAALAQGRGVLLLQGHFLSTDVAGQILAAEIPLTVTYQPPKNPVMRSLTERVRGRFIRHQIHHGEVRQVLRALRDNEVVWHGPDQGARERHAVPARFFGQPASTNTATARLARISGAPVVPYHPVRCADGSFELRFEPALADFPGDDIAAATQRVNDVLEAHVRETPAPYLWTHKRFKRATAQDPYA